METKVTNKGMFDGVCNRGVCNATHVKWFNSSTQKYYCFGCMTLITRWPENQNLFTEHTDETAIPDVMLGWLPRNLTK